MTTVLEYAETEMFLLGIFATACLIAPPAQEPAGDLGALSARAREAMATERYLDAVALYEKLLQARPADAGLLMNLGIARVLGGRPADAVAPLNEAVRLDDSLTPAWLFLGRAHADLGQPQEAVGPLERALTGDAGNLGARRLLAESQYAIGRFEAAAAEYRRLTDRQPDSPRAWYGLASSYSALTAKSIEDLQATGDSPYAQLLRAELAMGDGDPREAASLVQGVLAARPDLPGTHTILADAYEQLGQTADAAAARQRAVAVAASCTAGTAACALARGEPLQAATLAAKGADAEAVYWRLQAYNALAADAWQRLDGLPPSSEWHYVRSLAAEDQGRPQDALEELRRARALDPSNREIMRRLGVRLLRTRQVDEAITLLEEATRGETEPELRYLLGEAYLLAQRAADAVAPLEAAVKTMPQLTPARTALGRAYLQTGRPAEAIPHLEAGLPQDRDGSLYYQLAQAYQRAGRMEEAKKALGEYQRRSKQP